MRKRIIFLIPLLLLLPITVKANTSSFYEGEYINDIYMNKVKNNTIYYQKARFFRKANTNEPVYCIEPFATFNENSNYQETSKPNTLTQYQKDRISLLSYYGYNYKNHTDEKWYVITQFLIWKESDPTAKYYFTDTLNGNKISKFENEINELNNLVNNHNNKKPSFDNQTFYLVYKNSLQIKDNNLTLDNYTITSQNANKIKNMLIIENLEPGTHQITLEKKYEHNKQISYFQSYNSQDLVDIGNPETITSSLTVIVQETNLEIKKIDKDTKTTTPSGTASLIGTTFEIYNSQNKKVKEVTLQNDSLNITGLAYGTYYLKEKEPGNGYKLNENIYQFEISTTSPTVSLEIENEVIKKEIIINKLYGVDGNFQPEKNISFNIYNNNNEFITTIKTNNQGKTSIILPYGTYTIKQLTTTEGYQKVEPIQIIVDNEEPENITLKNYKIQVPNTSTKNKNIFSKIIIKLKDLCQKLNYLFY